MFGAVSDFFSDATAYCGNSGGLELITARYGIDSTWVDLTARFQAMAARDGYIIGKISNSMCGEDPAPGKRKKLKIYYRVKGNPQKMFVSVWEGERIGIP